jgi:group I intron endonuclease
MCKTYQIHEVGDYGVIYCLTSPSGKKYIGQSWEINIRFSDYKNLRYMVQKQPKIYNALKKYGPENFTYEIIDLCETQTEMDNKEIFYINIVYDSMNSGYNCLSGGSNGKHSLETRLLMSKKHKNLKWSEKRRNSFNNSTYKFKISEWHLKKFHAGRDSCQPGMKNKKQSEYQKNVVSVLFKEKPKSESHREKLSKAKEKFIYKITSPNGDVYITTNLKKFCEEKNLNRGNMARVANGYKMHYKFWKVEKCN